MANWQTRAAQPPGQASAAASAQHGEDGAVADQVEHGVALPGLGDPFAKVRPLDLRPDSAERRQHRVAGVIPTLYEVSGC